ncbi:MAG TPA: hypothetical protein DEF45_15055 [Rhodopirellula sp.]|nr:hypothetical protein [Rhodopirellula sp.]
MKQQPAFQWGGLQTKLMNRVQIVPSAHWAVMQNPVELVRKQQETIRSVCCGEGIEARADHQYQAWVLPQMAARAG